MINCSEVTSFIKDKAIELGFNDVGITKPSIKVKEVNILKERIQRNQIGSLFYLKDNLEKRENIQLLFPEVKSIVVVVASYYQGDIQWETKYRLSHYMLTYDYHNVLISRLKQLLLMIKENYGNEIEGWPFCDSMPVFEKSYAVDAGLGWIGKNTLLIHPDYGSFVVIGGLALSIELLYDNPLNKSCPDNCNICLESCPTKALISDYALNIEKCISYATVENKDTRFPVSNPSSYIAGCDICQLKCPFNQRLVKSNRLLPTLQHLYWKDEEWENITTSSFKKNLHHTPLRRIGLRTLRRNIKEVLQKND